MVRVRRLRRELGSLVATTDAAPPTLLRAVERVIWRDDAALTPVRARARIVATMAGATAAAGVLGVAMWRRTHSAG